MQSAITISITGLSVAIFFSQFCFSGTPAINSSSISLLSTATLPNEDCICNDSRSQSSLICVTDNGQIIEYGLPTETASLLDELAPHSVAMRDKGNRKIGVIKEYDAPPNYELSEIRFRFIEHEDLYLDMNNFYYSIIIGQIECTMDIWVRSLYIYGVWCISRVTCVKCDYCFCVRTAINCHIWCMVYFTCYMC
jgi:hypothetical protein